MTSKKDLVTRIAELTGLTQKDVAKVVDAHADVVIDALKHGNEVPVSGLGKLVPALRPGRTARNPKTGAPIEVLPSVGVKFKAASTLKAALN